MTLDAQPAGTLVLHAGPGTGAAAGTLVARQPNCTFHEVSDGLPAALASLADRPVRQLILVGTAAELAHIAARPERSAAAVLGEITEEMGDDPGLAAQVAAAPVSAGPALWRDAGLLGRCGRELCRRAAAVVDRLLPSAVEPAAPQTAADRPAVQVVLVDPPVTGAAAAAATMVAMFGRLAPTAGRARPAAPQGARTAAPLQG